MGGKLSLDDLEGAEVISEGSKPAGKLSLDDLEGAEVVSEGRDVKQMARAAAGRAPGPRDLTDEEAGTESGLVTSRSPVSPGMQRGPVEYRQQPEREAPSATDYTAAKDLPGGGRSIRVSTGNPNEMGDPGVQMATATALGMAAGAPLGGVGGRIAPLVRSGLEGGTANVSMGGDFDTGAALGMLPFAGKAALRTIAGENAGRTMTNAGAVKSVTKGATKAPAKAVNKVKFAAGEDGSRLADVLSEVPEARRAVTVKASTNPKGAAADLDRVITAATDANDEAFAAIQRQHKGVPLMPLAERLTGLEERLNLQGRGVAADAVNRVRTDILKRYGSGEAGLADAKLSAQQIRNMRNDMGAIADPARAIPANTKRQALAKIYEVLNKEIEDVAANTSGVDVNALRARNRHISTLIPVRDALAARAESQAERTVGAKLKSLPGRAIRRGLKEAQAFVEDIPAADASHAAAVPLRPVEDKRK